MTLEESSWLQSASHQCVRFEASGPAPTEVLSWLRNFPPRTLAGVAIIQIEDRLQEYGALAFRLDQCRLEIRANDRDRTIQLTGGFWEHAANTSNGGPDRTAIRRQIVSLTHAVVSLISDLERAMQAKHLRGAVVPSDFDIDERAAELFGSAPATLDRADALRLAVRCIDLTTLTGDDTAGRVRALCAQARHPDPTDMTVGPTAAVCVYPNLISVAKELTSGSRVLVASVAGAFPSGLSSLEVRLTDIAEAVCSGADEIDVVLNRAAFLAGDAGLVHHELRQMRKQIGGRVMKVILGTGELASPAAIRSAASIAIDAGADWIKTSTGKSAVGATPVAVLAMAETIAHHAEVSGRQVGLKISGGVRTSSDALGYLNMVESTLGPTWLHPDGLRFGASGLLTALVNDLIDTTDQPD